METILENTKNLIISLIIVLFPIIMFLLLENIIWLIIWIPYLIIINIINNKVQCYNKEFSIMIDPKHRIKEKKKQATKPRKPKSMLFFENPNPETMGLIALGKKKFNKRKRK